MFTKWLKVGMGDMQEWTEEVLESRLYSFVFFMYVQSLWQGQKAVLTIVEFDFFLISSILNFNKYQNFPFGVNFVLKMGIFAVTWAANE